MTVAELRAAGEELYGREWQTRLAETLRVDGSTVRRWVSGAVPIPGPVEAAIRCFLDRRSLYRSN
jgi:hypothetical protein